MTSNVSGTITIDAPPATVFAILTDPRQHSRIDGSGSVQDVVEAPDTLSLGATFSVQMHLGTGYKVTNKVVEFEQDRLIAWKHFAPQRWRYELEPTTGAGGGEATRVTETWDVSHYPWFTRFGLTVAGFPKRNKAGIDGTLVKLKEAAERDAGR